MVPTVQWCDVQNVQDYSLYKENVLGHGLGNESIGEAQVESDQPMAPESVIRDRNGNRIGSIVDNGHQLVARDKHSNTLGYFDPLKNVTSDRNSNRICEGNALSALIFRAAGG
jgi:hypothetical protein